MDTGSRTHFEQLWMRTFSFISTGTINNNEMPKKKKLKCFSSIIYGESVMCVRLSFQYMRLINTALKVLNPCTPISNVSPCECVYGIDTIVRFSNHIDSGKKRETERNNLFGNTPKICYFIFRNDWLIEFYFNIYFRILFLLLSPINS